MNLEYPTFESHSESHLDVISGYEAFIPDAFRQDPAGYFESVGKNIKSGEIKYGDAGEIREDPTAVKAFPEWTGPDGESLSVIGKRVNTEKGKVRKSGNPFYEYDVMEMIQSIGLPCPKPVARAEQEGVHLIITEKAKGIGWYDKDMPKLRMKGYNEADVQDLENQARVMMDDLRLRFEIAGISRDWKLQDMIFDVDVEHKKILGIIPTDWEKTTVDVNKLNAYRQNK